MSFLVNPFWAGAGAAEEFDPLFTFMERSNHIWVPQSAARTDTHYYGTAYFTSGADYHTLMKFDLNYNLVRYRNMGTDGDGVHRQINGIYVDEAAGLLRVCANNYNLTARGWVFDVDPDDLSVVAYRELSGAKWTEAVVRWSGSWWEVNASGHEIRQFDDTWTLVDTHALPDASGGGNHWQAIFVVNDVFYVVHHETGGADLRAYEWNGSGFTAVSTSLALPSSNTTQGANLYEDEIVWSERVGTGTGGTYNIVTSTAYDKLYIRARPVPVAREGVAYPGFTVESFNATGTITYSVQAGSLPAGLSLNSSTGAVTGTPSAAGTSSGIVIRATDGTTGQTADTDAFDIVVGAALGSGWVELGRTSTVADGAITLENINTAGCATVQVYVSGITTADDDSTVGVHLLGEGHTPDIHTSARSSTGNTTAVAGSRPSGHSPMPPFVASWQLGNDAGENFGTVITVDNPYSNSMRLLSMGEGAYTGPSGAIVRSEGAGGSRTPLIMTGARVVASSAITAGKLVVIGIR